MLQPPWKTVWSIRKVKIELLHVIGSEVKASACNVGDLGSIPGSGRFPGEGNGNPLQYSCLENPTDGGAWWATVHRVAKSRTQLSDFTHSYDPAIVILGNYTDKTIIQKDIRTPKWIATPFTIARTWK